VVHNRDGAIPQTEYVVWLAVQMRAVRQTIFELAPVSWEINDADGIAEWIKLEREFAICLKKMMDESDLRVLEVFEDRTSKMVKRHSESHTKGEPKAVGTKVSHRDLAKTLRRESKPIIVTHGVPFLGAFYGQFGANTHWVDWPLVVVDKRI